MTTASYEARRFGIGSAARARRLCADAVFLEPDFAYYRAASADVMAIVRAHVETVEVVGLDEAYLELTGLPAPHASMRRVAAQIRAATGLGCSVGIGPSKLVAKVASDAEKPAGFVVLTREQACARFAGSPPGLIPGIGPKTAERLRALGIETLAKLAETPAERLSGPFGARLAGELRRRARFEDGAPVTEERKVISESRELTFDRDISDRAELEGVLRDIEVMREPSLEYQIVKPDGGHGDLVIRVEVASADPAVRHTAASRAVARSSAMKPRSRII